MAPKKTELLDIDVDKVKPNPMQPREHFDRDKLKELAESILGNGLINPITVRKKGKGYEIVAGERRWKAHQIAKIKTIPSLVKEYKDEGQVAVESLIENVHREDLDPWEKAKFLIRIKEMENIKSNNELGKRIGMSKAAIDKSLTYLNVDESIKKKVSAGTLNQLQARTIGGLKDKKLQKRVSKIAEKLTWRDTEKLTSTIKKAPEEVKEALLDDEITTEQAERISKLDTEKSREKAIQEHKNIKMVDKGIERNIKNQMSAKEKRAFDKGLLQAGNWIKSFRGSVSDFYSQGEKTLRILLLCTKFLSIMDEKQKERLDIDLNRLIETSDKIKQLAEQIQEKIE